MSQKFQASVQQRGDVSYVKLGGVIDEDNELSDLVDKIPAGTALIDVGEIERINSCGVRDWVNWLGKLDGQGAKSVLVECSPAIVAQINLVNNFTGNGVVKSFYVPYFCPECDEEKVLLVQGTGFNWRASDHFRVVFLPNVDDLTEAIKRIARFLENYRNKHAKIKQDTKDTGVAA